MLSAAAFAASVNAFAALPSDVAGTRYEEPVRVLNALKIMVGDDNGTFRLEDTITRSEVAKMAVHAMGMESAASKASRASNFKDVPSSHWANGYINVATSLGLLKGDGDGNFRPDDSIMYAEAMTIFVRATGYEEAAKSKGGFPNGYMTTGTAAGLADNVKASAGEDITRGNVAFLTENALEANLMEQTGFGPNSKYEITDKTLLKDRLKVQKLEGQITSAGGASIDGLQAASDGYVRIDKSLYKADGDFANLLGFNVVYYLQTTNSGDEVVTLAVPRNGQNATIEITPELFSKVTTRGENKAIEYFRSETTTQKNVAEIAADAVMIYNGRKIDFNEDKLDFSDREGSIVLLDTTKDSKYDIVFVNEYKNIVVDSVTSSNKIVDKYGSGTLKLDDSVDFTLKKGGKDINISELKEFDVLSVYESEDKSLYSITVSSNSVEGTITSKDDEGVYIGGERYKIAKNYTELLEVGVKGTFYLDASGRIAAADTTSALSSNYAYLMNAYTNSGTEVSSFKLYTKNGETKTYNANAKIRFNGTTVTAASAVTSLVSDGAAKKQLVTFEENSDGMLTSINTAVDNSSTGKVNKDKFTLNHKLDDAVYDADLSKLGNVRVDSRTIVFGIPNDSTEYEILDKSVFEDGQSYDAHVYDMTESYTARVIVLTNSALVANADSPLAVVKQVSSAVNSDGERTELLTALVDGEEKKLYAADDTVLEKDDDAQLEAGDLIQYKTNSKGEIVSVRVLFDIETKDTEASEEPVENLKTIYGKVTKKFTDSINVTVDDEDEANHTLSEDVKVYIVDTTLPRNNVEAADAGDIRAFDDDEGNRVFLKLYKDVVEEAVIVK